MYTRKYTPKHRLLLRILIFVLGNMTVAAMLSVVRNVSGVWTPYPGKAGLRTAYDWMTSSPRHPAGRQSFSKQSHHRIPHFARKLLVAPNP
jgi:hypothetical protein